MIDLITAAGGNLGSVRSLLERTGTGYREIDTPGQLEGGSPILIPGVGSFGAVMERLNTTGLTEAIREQAKRGRKILGICSGMQVLLKESEESPEATGLGLIPGKVEKLRITPLPNIGWSRLERANVYVYFVNSYHAVTEHREDTAEGVTAIVRKGSITGFQFHPEKSHRAGEELFRRWRDDL